MCDQSPLFIVELGIACGPGSSVGIATGYGLDGPGIESGGARFSAPGQTGPWAHPSSCTMGTGSFPGVKSGRCLTLTPSPPSSAVVKKQWSYTSTPPMGRTVCTEPQCLYKGALYLYFTLTPHKLKCDHLLFEKIIWLHKNSVRTVSLFFKCS